MWGGWIGGKNVPHGHSFRFAVAAVVGVRVGRVIDRYQSFGLRCRLLGRDYLAILVLRRLLRGVFGMDPGRKKMLRERLWVFGGDKRIDLGNFGLVGRGRSGFCYWVGGRGCFR